MTSIRQTKKAGKKLVAEGFNNIAERRERHYSRVYKHFHAAKKKLLSDMQHHDDSH